MKHGVGGDVCVTVYVANAAAMPRGNAAMKKQLLPTRKHQKFSAKVSGLKFKDSLKELKE